MNKKFVYSQLFLGFSWILHWGNFSSVFAFHFVHLKSWWSKWRTIFDQGFYAAGISATNFRNRRRTTLVHGPIIHVVGPPIASRTVFFAEIIFIFIKSWQPFECMIDFKAVADKINCWEHAEINLQNHVKLLKSSYGTFLIDRSAVKWGAGKAFSSIESISVHKNVQHGRYLKLSNPLEWRYLTVPTPAGLS